MLNRKPPETEEDPHRGRRLRGLLWGGAGAAILVVGAVIWAFEGDLISDLFHWFRGLDEEGLRNVIQSWGPWAPVVSFGLMIVHTFVPFPLEILAAANGFLFGTAGGIALTWSSMVVSAWVGYAAARFANRLIFKIASAERLRRMEAWAARRSDWELVAVRFIPIISFSLLNLALGLLRLPFWRFTWTTALGIIPIVSISVVSGHLMTAGPWGWVGVGVLVAVLVGFEVYRYRKNRGKQ